MIRIKNVTVIKSGKKLLENFSLEIKHGEHCVLTGRNGAGKTIVLELIAGIVHPARGTVEYDFITSETWEERYWERKQKIQFIPTHAIQHFLTNSAELYYQQRYYNDGDNRSRCVKDILGIENDATLHALKIPETLAIHALLNVEVHRLSNGQLKKVLLLKSLLKEHPSVLLLDYPFEGLDKASREDLSNFIDFIATTYAIQVILIDHHHHLPSVINRTLVMNAFNITDTPIDSLAQHSANDKKNPIVHESQLTTASVIVEMKNLKIQYGDVVILNDFNWVVRKGERWALVGRNGSGKTTVFSLIFADHPMAYSQQVYLFEKRRGTGESIWDIKRRMTYLGPELINYLNAKNILLSAREYILSLGKKVNKTKLEELVLFFEAKHFIDNPVKSLSSGELQLMLVINSFLEDKELLLLDEPFQFLDNKQKALMTRYLQEHLQQNTTLILITHYDADISSWTRKIKRIE